MKVRKLQFENFRSFSHNEITFPDFPIVVIYDENGKGKTSIQEGVLWSLAGEIYRYNRKDLKSEYGTTDALYNLRANENSRIQLIMEMEDNKGKSLTTKINRPQRNKTYLTASQDSDQKYSVNGNSVTKREFQEIIENFLNLEPRQFQTTNFLSQEIINEALVTDENIRANVFSQLLSFDWMQDINSLISDEIKELRKVKRGFEHKKSELLDKIQETEINKLWDELQTQVQQLQDEHNLKFQQPSKIQVIDYLKRVLTASKLINNSELSNEVNNYISGSENTQDLTIEKLKEYHKTIRENIKDYRSKIGGLESKTKVSKEETKTIISTISNYKKRKQKVSELDEKIKSKSENRDTNSEKLDENKTEYNKFLIKYKEIKTLKDTYNRLIKKLENLSSEKGNLTDIESNLKTIDEKAAELQKLADFHQKNIEKITEKKDDLELLASNVDSISTKLKNLQNRTNDKLKEILEPLLKRTKDVLEYMKEEDSDKIELHSQKLSELIKGDPLDYLAIKENSQVMIDNIMSIPIQSRIVNLEQKQQKLKQKQSELKNLPHLEELNSSINGEIEKIEKDNQSLKHNIEHLGDQIENNQDSIGSLRQPGIISVSILSLISLILISFVPSPLEFVFIAFALLGVFSSVLLFKPGIWFKPSHINSFLEKLIPIEEIKKWHLDETKQLKHQISLNESKLIDLRQSSLENQQKIDILKNLDQSNNGSNKGDLSSIIDAYQNLSEQKEQYENCLNYVNDLIDKDQLNSKLEEEKGKLTKLEDKLRNSLKQFDDTVDYESNLTTILGKSKSVLLELEKNITDMVKKKKSLEETRDKFRDIQTQRDENLKKLVNNYKLDPDKLEQNLNDLEEKKNSQETVITELTSETNEIQKEITKLNDEKTNVQSNFTSDKNYLSKQFVALDLDEELLEKEESELKQIIDNIHDKTEQERKEITSSVEQVESLSEELSLLDDYFAKLNLLQSRWNEKQNEIQMNEAKIEIYDKKIANVDELEKSWKLVSDEMQDTTEDISDKILQVIKDDVLDYFETLGGHDSLSYVDLEIRVIRNKLNVSINVGTDEKNTGSPKILYSNGQQVSLILAIFFAMGRQILKKSKFSWIGLDEPTQYLDTNRKADFVDFIHVFYEQNPEVQLIITTADREFINMLENKSEDIFHITDVNSISSATFSAPNTSNIPVGISDITADLKAEIKPIELPELNDDLEFDLPDPTELPKRTVSSIGIIDELPESKEFKCSICQITFKSLTYQNTCNNSECISEFRQTMLFG